MMMEPHTPSTFQEGSHLEISFTPLLMYKNASLIKLENTDILYIYIQVEINGIISFSEPFYRLINPSFPEGAPGAYVVAPYSDDIDLRLAGDVSYEVHSRSANNPGSNHLLDEVSGFVENSTGQSFEGSWMLVAEWREVHQYPHGDPTRSQFYPGTSLVSEGLRHLQLIFMEYTLAYIAA